MIRSRLRRNSNVTAPAPVGPKRSGSGSTSTLPYRYNKQWKQKRNRDEMLRDKTAPVTLMMENVLEVVMPLILAADAAAGPANGKAQPVVHPVHNLLVDQRLEFAPKKDLLAACRLQPRTLILHLGFYIFYICIPIDLYHESQGCGAGAGAGAGPFFGSSGAGTVNLLRLRLWTKLKNSFLNCRKYVESQ